MKYQFNYGSDVISLPKSAAERLGSVSRDSLAVLISLAADRSLEVKERAEALAIGVEAVEKAIEYWCALGVVSPIDESVGEKKGARPGSSSAKGSEKAAKSGSASVKIGEGSAKSGSARSRRIALENTTPHLTTLELAAGAEDDGTSHLLEYCQQKLGRLLNTAEAERVVGICDYLGVSSDFVAMLCDYLKKDGELTVRALENLAIELHDLGITELGALISHMNERDIARSFEKKVRKLFGLGSRVLTGSEKKLLARWAHYGMDEAMIEFAYELTVEATGNASLKYTNAIIESWASENIASVEDAKKREEAFKARTTKKKPTTRAKKKRDEAQPSSFETDDFFENALRRSFGDEFYDNVWVGDAASADGTSSDEK